MEADTRVRDVKDMAAVIREQREHLIGSVTVEDIGELLAFTMSALALLCEMIDRGTEFGIEEKKDGAGESGGSGSGVAGSSGDAAGGGGAVDGAGDRPGQNRGGGFAGGSSGVLPTGR